MPILPPDTVSVFQNHGQGVVFESGAIDGQCRQLGEQAVPGATHLSDPKLQDALRLHPPFNGLDQVAALVQPFQHGIGRMGLERRAGPHGRPFGAEASGLLHERFLLCAQLGQIVFDPGDGARPLRQMRRRFGMVETAIGQRVGGAHRLLERLGKVGLPAGAVMVLLDRGGGVADVPELHPFP